MKKYFENYSNNIQLAESYDPLVDEKKILEFWTKNKAFEKVQGNRGKENEGKISFHCGPPFPTGSPHSGHILNAIVKDVFTRYGYQKNVQVDSQFGWDCHGLAVEHEVDKKLGIKSIEDIEKLGISNYNDECLKFVQRHEAEWKIIFDRIGNWVDFKNVYSTMSPEYMENVWAVFKQLYDSGLVYKDNKVLPFSTGCFSHLSNFEAEQNWKVATETSVTISVNIVKSNVKLLIWTTSPWTLVANLSICVNPNLSYVKVQMNRSDHVYILLKSRLPFVFKSPEDYIVLEEFPGKHIQGLGYEPLFDYFPDAPKAYQVFADEYIRNDLGTGIVALSPYFNEDAYRVCQKNDISFDEELCPIDNSGRFKQHTVSEVAGLFISEASDVVVKILKQRGHFVAIQNIQQKKQHCWRSDVPLIHKTVSTWFIKVKNNAPNDEESCSEVNWRPHCTRNSDLAQFGDWAVGRMKFWGTPIPIWSSPSGDEIRCIGSVDELLKLSGRASVSNLHRESVDHIRIPSSIPGNPPLRRVPDVFDCWFESGVMPFIQQRTQADFIAEGIDQTFGWFHTTSVLASALSLPPPSRNIVVHGLVESSDGTKMSKRKHNINDPIHIAEKYGADALRLYLVSTPLVKGENFLIQEDEVRKMVDCVINPLYKILYDLLPLFGKKGRVFYGIAVDGVDKANIFDRWLLSCTESLMQFYDTELMAYRLHSIIPRIIKLMKQVHDWYIPLRRLVPCKSKRESNDAFLLFNVFYKICLVLSPFAPFVTEHVYQILKPFAVLYYQRDFMHDSLLTVRSDSLVQSCIERQVARWQMVVELVREMRMNRLIPIQYRIHELIVVHPVDGYLGHDELLKEAMMILANVQQLTISTDRYKFGAILKAGLKTNSSWHQCVSRTQFDQMANAIEQLNDVEVEDLIKEKSLIFNLNTIPLEDIQITYEFEKESERNSSFASKDDLLVVILMKRELDYYEEGTRRELIGCVQKLKKKANMFDSELVNVYYLTQDKCLKNAFQKFAGDVKKSTNSVVELIDNACMMKDDIIKETVDIKGMCATLYLVKIDKSI